VANRPLQETWADLPDLTDPSHHDLDFGTVPTDLTGDDAEIDIVPATIQLSISPMMGITWFMSDGKGADTGAHIPQECHGKSLWRDFRRR
jgi:hypothetical protein